MLWRRLRTTRRVVQAFFFVAFLVLLFAALQRRDAFPYADLFFRLDPLIALTAMLAGKVWLPRLALAFVTVAMTIVLGRVWCGWICPLGTLLEWAQFKKARRRAKRLPPRLPVVKYLLLAAIVAAALFDNLTLMILDPLALLTRATATAVIPGTDWAILQIEDALRQAGIGQSAVDFFEQAFRGRVLPQTPAVFQQAVPAFLLLLAVVLLGLLADRFWCRFLCPLGALLGLLAKVAVLRPIVTPSLRHCAACAGVCRQEAITVVEEEEEEGGARSGVPDRAEGARPGAVVVTSECVMCLDCLVAHGRKGMVYGVQPRPAPWQRYDPSRRQLLAGLAAGVGGVVLLGAGAWNARRAAGLIRPPGVTDESVFLASCVRCSQCLKVCPTSGLQPALDEAGLVGLWTPVLKPRLGYCDYGCHACGQMCPSGAIPKLDLATKREQVLGLAWIDRDRCLPWAYDTTCVVCWEMCPVADKAVKVTQVTVTAADGSELVLQRPHVVADLCIGCGICEYRCPVAGRAAIQVTVSG